MSLSVLLSLSLSSCTVSIIRNTALYSAFSECRFKWRMEVISILEALTIPATTFSTSLVAQMVKKPACNAGNLGSIPRLRRSLEEGNGYPSQNSCLENSMKEEPGRLQSMGSQNNPPHTLFSHIC